MTKNVLFRLWIYGDDVTYFWSFDELSCLPLVPLTLAPSALFLRYTAPPTLSSRRCYVADGAATSLPYDVISVVDAVSSLTV